ncbi:MAG: hypothetical protein VX704_02015 [Verrucomicrobiota bacterium]|nr:hypothetical protein [Verrucomicrobiota bacterium]
MNSCREVGFGYYDSGQPRFGLPSGTGGSVSLGQAGRKVSFGYTQERLKYFAASRSNCLESRLAKR